MGWGPGFMAEEGENLFGGGARGSHRLESLCHQPLPIPHTPSPNPLYREREHRLPAYGPLISPFPKGGIGGI